MSWDAVTSAAIRRTRILFYALEGKSANDHVSDLNTLRRMEKKREKGEAKRGDILVKEESHALPDLSACP